MSDPLADFLDLAWMHLARGVAESQSPARYPVLATVSPKGAPEARTVALRKADRSAGTVEIHTDVHSHKIASLRHDPRAQLHVWDRTVNLQIRLSLEVTILTGAVVSSLWSGVPTASRTSYGTTPTPGTPIASAFAYEKPSDPAAFAVLQGAIAMIDLVDLNEPHRRALYAPSDGWAGQWLSP